MELSVCQVTGIFCQKVVIRLVVLYLARGENTDDLKGWMWSCIRLPVWLSYLDSHYFWVL